jgi:uncharacterized RDD family membrane protein YckC
MSTPPGWSDEPSQTPPPPGPSQPGHGQPYPPQPYAPQPSGAPAGGPAPGALGGFWIRFAGAIVDGLILGVVTGIVSAPFGVAADTGWWLWGGPSGLLTLAVGGAYFTYLHSTRAGQTVGQLVCGIRLVRAADGGQVEPGNAAIRWLMSYVSGLPLALGYLWMLWDPARQTWHDKVASTYVVRTSHYPPPASFGQR